MADRYWVLTSGGTWNETAGAKWSETSGGAVGASVPTSSDNVFFDANSGSGTITQSGSRACRDFNHTGFTGTFAGTGNLNITGDITLSPLATYNNTGQMQLTSTSNLNYNGVTTWSKGLQITGTVTLLSDIKCGSINLTDGTFDANDFNVTLTSFSSTSSNNRTLRMGSGSWYCTGWVVVATNFTLLSEVSTLTIENTSSAIGVVNFGTNDLVYNTVVFKPNYAGYGLSNGQRATINNLEIQTPNFIEAGNADFTIGNTFTVTGDDFAVIRNERTSNFLSFVKDLPNVELTNVILQNTNFSGAATWVARNSYDLGNNIGIIIENPALAPEEPEDTSQGDYFLYEETSGYDSSNIFDASNED
jgi:hypothetical protein